MPQNAHSTAKGGVIALTLQLVVEGGPHGIRANVISPGLIETPNTAPMLADPPERLQQGRPRPDPARPARPARRTSSTPRSSCASDEASWISGTHLVVDGGGSVLG